MRADPALLAVQLDVFRAAVEILVLATGIFVILKFLESTRGFGILKGLFVLLFVIVLVLTGIAAVLQSERLELVRSYVVQYSILAGLIIFQPELRRALVRLGQNPFMRSLIADSGGAIDQIVKAVGKLSGTRTGALIAIEQEVALTTFIENGTVIDAVANADLLCTIFHDGTVLHDGAVILRGDRIMAAAAYFPLTENEQIPIELGTRHRAAIGLTEDTDAVVIVVSEETGRISIAHKGQLQTGVSLEDLRERLVGLQQAPKRMEAE